VNVPRLQLLIRAIAEADSVRVTGAELQFDDAVTLEIDVDGEPFVLSLGDVRVVSGNAAKLTGGDRDHPVRVNRVKDADKLSVDELRSRGLPPYWNEAWLRSEFARLGSYAEVARVHGLPNPTVVAAYAKRNFGMDVQAGFDQKRDAAIRDYSAALATASPITAAQLASRYDVALATVYRWIKEYREGPPGDRSPGTRRRSAKQPTDGV
jgi:hypothetical protein